MLPAIKIRKPRKPRPVLPAPQRPTLSDRDEPEVFAGEVKGKKASMAEERFFRELDKSKIIDGYEFRRSLGAPRGLPGWIEIDGLVASKGMIYAVEIDSAFTHRDKKESDRLHDTRVLTYLKKMGLNVFPNVIHIDGELDLVDKNTTKTTVKRLGFA